MDKQKILQEPWLAWAMELQSIAQNGLTYAKDIYDIERYTRLRDITAEMLAYQSDIPLEKVKTLFCNEQGYQTPKIDTRAAVFQGDKILLVHEKSGHWSLPGGWCDVLESIRSNTIKEVKEESGYDVACKRVIALQDRNKHNTPIYAYGILKVFVECELLGGSFIPNSETSEAGFFAFDELPDLANEKNTYDQILLCFLAHKETHWQVFFD